MCRHMTHMTHAPQFLKLLRRRIENEREPELRNNFDSAGNRIKASRRDECASWPQQRRARQDLSSRL